MKKLVWIGASIVVVAGGVAWPRARADDAPTNNLDYADLGSTDPNTRESAIAALAAKSATTIANLTSALNDEPAPIVKAGLVDAIARLGPSDTQVDGIRTLLRAVDPTTRVEAARLLGRTNPGRAREALESVAADRTEQTVVRCAAAVAAGRAGAEARNALAGILAQAGTPAPVRSAAIRGLALSGGDGATDVKKIATSTKATTTDRVAAWAALADPDAVSESVLIDLFLSTDSATRARAVGALSARGTATNDGKGALAALLTDDSASVRRAAVEALASLGGVNANRDAVLALLADADTGVIGATARVVGRAFADEPSGIADQLAPLLQAADFSVRMHAALALASLGDAGGSDVMKADATSESLGDDAHSMADAAAKAIDAATAAH